MNSYDIMSVVLGIIAVAWVLCIGLYIFYAVCYMKLFDKAYVAKWKAWVPFVNTWALFEICGFPGWITLLSFVPLANFAFLIISLISMYRLPICYGKSSGWGVLNIFFPIIVIPIIAFGDSEYCGYDK